MEATGRVATRAVDGEAGNTQKLAIAAGDEQSGLSTVYGLDYTPASEWTLSALFQSSIPMTMAWNAMP